MPLTSTSASISASSSSAGHARGSRRADDEMPREVANVFGLALATGRRRAASRCACAARGPGRAAPRSPRVARFQQPLPDRLRRLDRDLLADDRARQRGERVAAAGEVEAGILGDQLREHAVPLGERARRFVPVVRFGHRARWHGGRRSDGSGRRRHAQRSAGGAVLRAHVRARGISAGNVTLRRFFPSRSARCVQVPAIGEWRRCAADRRIRRSRPTPPRCFASRFRSPRPASTRSASRDLYSNTVNEAIFERLLTYDYLARPAKLVPMTAEAMPEVTDGGRTYVLHLRRGIYFTPDPAFKGQRRELVAEDYVYTFKRFADPEEPLAVGVHDRRADRGPRRAGRGGEENRQVRLRRDDSRA